MAASASSTGTLLNESELERLQERLSRRSVQGNNRKAVDLKLSDLHDDNESNGGRQSQMLNYRNASPNLLLYSSEKRPLNQQQQHHHNNNNNISSRCGASKNRNSENDRINYVNENDSWNTSNFQYQNNTMADSSSKYSHSGYSPTRLPPKQPESDVSQFLVTSGKMADRYVALPGPMRQQGFPSSHNHSPLQTKATNNRNNNNNFNSEREPEHSPSLNNHDDDLVLRLQSRISSLEAMLEKSHEKLEYLSSSMASHQNHQNQKSLVTVSPALVTPTPDVFVLQRRIDEQNIRIASLEKALKVKESSIMHLSMSLENQLDTLHTYQEDITKMKLTISNLNSVNDQLTNQHNMDKDLLKKHEQLERDHADLSNTYDLKVRELSEQVVMMTERWQSCQSEISAEKQRHEETKERLSKVLENQVQHMSQTLNGRPLKQQVELVENGTGSSLEIDSISMQGHKQVPPINSTIFDFQDRLEKLESVIFNLLSPLAQTQGLSSSSPASKPPHQLEPAKSKVNANGGQQDHHGKQQIMFQRLKDQVKALKLQVANLQLSNNNQSVQTSPMVLEEKSEDDKPLHNVFQMYETGIADLRRILSAGELGSNSNSSGSGSLIMSSDGAVVGGERKSSTKSSALSPRYLEPDSESKSKPSSITNSNYMQSKPKTSQSSSDFGSSSSQIKMKSSSSFDQSINEINIGGSGGGGDGGGDSNTNSNTNRNSNPLQSAVLMQRRFTLEGELLASYAEFREREEEHHRLLKQKEAELAETERQLSILKTG